MFYVQYDGSGNICAMVIADTAPPCANQLTFDTLPVTEGKIVDTANKVLIDDPNYVVPA